MYESLKGFGHIFKGSIFLEIFLFILTKMVFYHNKSNLISILTVCQIGPNLVTIKQTPLALFLSILGTRIVHVLIYIDMFTFLGV